MVYLVGKREQAKEGCIEGLIEKGLLLKWVTHLIYSRKEAVDQTVDRFFLLSNKVKDLHGTSPTEKEDIPSSTYIKSRPFSSILNGTAL